MRGTWAIVACLVALCGCTAPPPSLDALFGRATIPPPRPGETIAEMPAEPYYSDGDAAPPPRRAADSTPGLAPPDGRYDRSSLAARPSSTSRTSSRASDAGWREGVDEEPAEPRRLRATNPEDTGPAAPRSGTSTRPRTTNQQAAAPGGALPPVQPVAARIVGRSGRVTPASFSAQADDEEEERPARASRRVTPLSERYGYDPDYRWLRGRLEHFQATGRWKLRYIPIDGETDEFGGSVVLEESPLLEDFQSGDFVQLRGELSGEGDGLQGFAPRFRVDRIEPTGS